MHLTELRTFLMIVETGSLVKASEQLNVTQSTVTARLQSLEDALGQQLMIRQRSGTILTPAGERLRRYADAISGLWRQARQEISLPTALNTVFNLGCHPDLWPMLGEELFEHARSAEPKTAISIWQGSRRDLQDWLNNGLIDIALTYWPTANQHQEIFPLYADRLILVSTERDTPVRFDPGYVFIEAGEDFGRDHAIAYADADTARITFGDTATGLNYLLREGGSAYLPERFIRNELKHEKLFILKDAPVFERKSFMISNRRTNISLPWLEAFNRNLSAK